MRSDLWYDELYSFKTATLPIGQMFHSLLLGGDTNPPLYTVLLHFWLKLGESDIHIRGFSLLFALASIGVMFRLGKLVGGIRLAVAASFLLAVSNSAIHYSLEARPYALYLFLTLLSTFLLLSASKKSAIEYHRPANRRVWLGYGIITTLAIYTHWFSLLLLPLHLLALFIYSRFSKAMVFHYLVVLLFILCCCLPLVPFLENQVGIQNTVGGFSWCGKPNRHSLMDLASFLAGGKNLLIATLIIFPIAFLSARRAPSPASVSKNHFVFFGAYVLVPILLVTGVSYSLAHYSFLVPRYFLPFIVGVHLLIAASLARMNKKLAVLFMVIFAFAPLVKVVKQRHQPERPYSLLATELSDHPDRLILHLTPMSYYPTCYYSYGSTQTQKVAWSETIGRGYVVDYNLKGEALNESDLLDIDAGVKAPQEFYVVRDFIDADPRVSRMANQLRSNGKNSLLSEKQIGNLSLELYQAHTDE